MSSQKAPNVLYLLWKDPVALCKYTLGQLSKNGQYKFQYGFQYGFEVKEAMEKGFKLLISFKRSVRFIRVIFYFQRFLVGCTILERRGIDQILSKYGLDKSDEYKLLKKSGARLPIDTLEFMDSF